MKKGQNLVKNIFDRKNLQIDNPYSSCFFYALFSEYNSGVCKSSKPLLGKCGNGNVLNHCHDGYKPWGKWYGPISGCWCHCCKVVPLAGGKTVFNGCGPWKKLTGKGGK